MEYQRIIEEQKKLVEEIKDDNINYERNIATLEKKLEAKDNQLSEKNVKLK